MSLSLSLFPHTHTDILLKVKMGKYYISRISELATVQSALVALEFKIPLIVKFPQWALYGLPLFFVLVQ